MTPEAHAKLEEFFSAFHSGATPLLFLDYDGTLAPFRIDRYRARPYAGVRQLLTRIQHQGRTQMAVVTGRPAGEIAPLLGIDPPLEVWGLHGAEHLYPDGRREIEQPSEQAIGKLDELRASLRIDSLGGHLEEKANGVVMHWRGASPSQKKLIERRTRSLFQPLAALDGLSLLDFEAGIELRSGRDKGGAIAARIDSAAAGTPVAFLGDDLTDEAGFRVVNAAPGPHLSALVRRQPRETEADVWLRPPNDLRTFLTRWAIALELVAIES